MDETPAQQQIDDIIRHTPGWQSQILGRLRTLILEADPDITEAVKWKKPSRPEGVPVWERAGNLCIGESLKYAVRLTFPKGALVADPHQLFNSRLDSKSVRAIDIHETDSINESALQALVRTAAQLNLKDAAARPRTT